MKINITIECSPEEARRFMGLPDVGPNVDKVNSAYADAVAKAMQSATSVDQLETYVKQFAPMGQIGLKLFQSIMETAANQGAASPDKNNNTPSE